jgi:hypothetical protein
VLPAVRGVCRFCAKSYGVLDAVESSGLPLLDDDRCHASLRGLLIEGRQIITLLGGYIGRAKDPHPGHQIMWHGYSILQAMCEGLSLQDWTSP